MALEQLGKCAAPEQDVGERDVVGLHEGARAQLGGPAHAVADHRHRPRERALERGRPGSAQRGVERGERVAHAGACIDLDELHVRSSGGGAGPGARRRVEARGEEHARVDAGVLASHLLVALEHGRKQAADLVRAAPGQDGDAPRARGHAERLASRRAVVGTAALLERGMADVVRVDAEAAPERLLERQHHRHAVEMTAQRDGPPAPPCPDLGRAVPEDARPGLPQRVSEACVELRVIYKKRSGGLPERGRCAHQRIGPRHREGPSCDLGDAERGGVAEIGDELDALCGERAAAHAEGSDAGRQMRDHGGRGAVPRSLAGNDEQVPAVHACRGHAERLHDAGSAGSLTGTGDVRAARRASP